MSERDWVHKYIRPLVQAEGADALRDDVALLSAHPRQIVTMDTLVEGRHFLSGDPLDTVGQKLIRVNVSDIHSKGAAPAEALLSIAWPEGRAEAEFAILMAGIELDLKAFEIDLIGGDFVTTAGPLVLTLTLTGRCFGDGPVRRAAATKAGDKVWVSGTIGSGVIGLKAALEGGAANRVQHYRVPQISSLEQARAVAAIGLAAMDVSDGLLTDALTLAQVNDLGIQINLNSVLLADSVDDLEGVLVQVTGGDDYQILLIASCEISGLQGFTCIGELTPETGLKLLYDGRVVNPPETLGFEH